MAKFTWQDGTLVSKAKVEIGGTIYEVDPEEYSGTTPLSASNLNAMEDGIYDDIGDLSELETSDKTDLVNAINSTLPVVLYEDQNGSYSDIVLNDNASNYSKLYIETKGLQYTDYLKYGSVFIDNPNGKSVTQTYSFYNFSNNQIYVVDTIFTINGTSITISGNRAGTVGANSAYGGSANCVGIIKVIGYK